MTDPTEVLCTFEGCGKPKKARGLCGGHWLQQKLGRTLTPIARPATTLERLMLRVRKDENGCWRWTGCKHKEGYGFTQAAGEKLAHRAVYVLIRGPIPPGLTLDHLCRVRDCVNPDHLDPCDIGTNYRRAMPFRKPKRFCPRGHEYTPDNVVRWRNGWRHCKTCGRERQRVGYKVAS